MILRRRVSRMGAGLTAAAVVAAAVSCGVRADEQAHVVPAEDVPFDLLDATTTTTADPASGGDQDTTACLALDGLLLSLPRQGGADTLLALVVGGPTEGEAGLRLRSAVDEDTVSDVTLSGDMARVDLTDSFAELPGDQQLLAVAQVTCTLTAQPDVRRVSFRLAGEPVEVPVQGGSLVGRPVVRADYGRLIVN